MTTPAWKGPEVDGITNSLLQLFLQCRERFRLLTIEGLQELRTYNKAIEFGSCFHEAEEAYREGQMNGKGSSLKNGMDAITRYSAKLRKWNPSDAKEITEWESILSELFPLYSIFEQEEAKKRNYFIQEATFKIPYKLPDGRTIYLRGKIDSGFWTEPPAFRQEAEEAPPKYIYLQENKCKGKIDQQSLPETLFGNLQTGIYLTAIDIINRAHPSKRHKFFADRKHARQWPKDAKIAGTLYNVIRRPFADFFAPKQGVKESYNDFLKRSFHGGKTPKGAPQKDNGKYPIAKNPDWWFMQWKIPMKYGTTHKEMVDDMPWDYRANNLTEFQTRILNPILTQLCDWYDWVAPKTTQCIYCKKPTEFEIHPIHRSLSRCRSCDEASSPLIVHTIADPYRPGNTLHFQYPFGVYHSLAGGFRGAYYEKLVNNREHDLEKITTLFPEL